MHLNKEPRVVVREVVDAGDCIRNPGFYFHAVDGEGAHQELSEDQT